VLGPLEFIVLCFEGDRVSGDVITELDRVRADGAIRIVDLVFVAKDEAGAISVRELSDLTDDEAEALSLVDEPDDGPGRCGWFAQDDVDGVAGQIPTSTSAVVVLFEHAWAARLRKAVRDAGGFVVVDGRVPADVVEAVEAQAADRRAGSVS
jgi:hypothetical protein